MDQQEGMSSKIAPLFKEDDYAFWIIRMRGYLMALGCDIYQSLAINYDIQSSPPLDTNVKKLTNYNARAINAILGGLTNSTFAKVMHCKTMKDIWDKLQLIYEGDTKVNQAKIQTHRGQFENLKNERRRKHC